MTVTDEQKKDAALDEEALKDVTGGLFDRGIGRGDTVQELLDEAEDMLHKCESAKNDKEETL